MPGGMIASIVKSGEILVPGEADIDLEVAVRVDLRCAKIGSVIV